MPFAWIDEPWLDDFVLRIEHTYTQRGRVQAYGVLKSKSFPCATAALWIKERKELACSGIACFGTFLSPIIAQDDVDDQENFNFFGKV